MCVLDMWGIFNPVINNFPCFGVLFGNYNFLFLQLARCLCGPECRPGEVIFTSLRWIADQFFKKITEVEKHF